MLADFFHKGLLQREDFKEIVYTGTVSVTVPCLSSSHPFKLIQFVDSCKFVGL